MTGPIAARAERPRWPMTREACDRLIDQIARLRQELTELTGRGLEEGIIRLSFATAARRLETLISVLDCADVTDTPCAAIGRRATLGDEDGQAMEYRIVFPGDGDPSDGSISADSPLGRALLGARPGDLVESTRLLAGGRFRSWRSSSSRPRRRAGRYPCCSTRNR